MTHRTALAIVIACLATTATAQEIRTTPMGSSSQLIRDGDVVEVFVDERGRIYKEMRYHGIIPDIRDHFGKKPSAGHRGASQITWVGFQQKRFYSRVFVQTSKLSRFVLHKPDARHIVLTFEQARIPKRNTLRPVDTSQFTSAVERVQARRQGARAEVVITLKKAAGYLYKQQGNYVFIDVER